MGTSPDFRDSLRSLSDAVVRYVIVGAYAVIYHTEPRYTKDLDIRVESGEANAARVNHVIADGFSVHTGRRMRSALLEMPASGCTSCRRIRRG